jgi:hypothetical protein
MDWEFHEYGSQFSEIGGFDFGSGMRFYQASTEYTIAEKSGWPKIWTCGTIDRRYWGR